MKKILSLLIMVCSGTFVLAQTDNIQRKKQSIAPNKTPVTTSKPKHSGSTHKNNTYRPATSNVASYSNGILIVKGVRYDFVNVEGGTFFMGTQVEKNKLKNKDKPHFVTLSHNYYIGKTEVTQALWQAVMGDNPSDFKGNNRPVECVSWDDCKKFISRLISLTEMNFRLPTEAEWEFAARGGNKSRQYLYSGSDYLSEVSWYSGNSENTTHDVATKLPNELGIYDMSGNVREWCLDYWGDYSSGPQTNPFGPTYGSYHVFRGGSFGDGADDSCTSRRYGDAPFRSIKSLGFRLVLSE